MRSIIRWFVENPIAANLLMLALLIGGYFGSGQIKKEVFPIFSASRILVSMSYPGAAPNEVEQQVVVRIEEAIAGLPGIFQVTSESRQSFGQVNIEVVDGFDVKQLLNDVKGRVDAINTFPPSAERPVIRQMVFRGDLMYIALTGDVDPTLLKTLAYQVRDELPLLDGISEVNIIGLKKDEVSIEISEENLRRYNLTFDEVARAIRGNSLSIPAGTIRSESGDIQIQTRSQAYRRADFESIVIRTSDEGGELRLGDIASVQDGFEERNIEFEVNGKPGYNLQVKISDDPKLFLGTENARRYVENMQSQLPPGVSLNISFENKSLFDSRFNLLKDNTFTGLVLVFIILMLFLRPLLAIWVVVGIVTTFAGAIWLLPYFGITLNMLSMFAFLMVLGIVVDDAIIVGESVYAHQQAGTKGPMSAISGAHSVLKPVFLAVMSTIIFFLPMADVPAEIESYTLSIFYVVMLCLVFSLVESLLILPSHLSHMKPEKESRNRLLQALAKTRQYFSSKMEGFAQNTYRNTLKVALRNKRTTFIGFAITFGLSIAVVNGGWLTTAFMPNVPMPFVMINFSYPEGTPYSQTDETVTHILKQVYKLKDDPELLAQNGGRDFVREMNKTVTENRAEVFVRMDEAEIRDVPVETVVEFLRENIGPIPEAQTYSLSYSLGVTPPDISLNLQMISNLREDQQRAVNTIVEMLASYPGVENVRNDLDSERSEIEIGLRDSAEVLGVSLRDIAMQVRQSFYGEEVQRIPRSKEDVKVMLRYPQEQRQTLDTLDDMRIRTLEQKEIPLSTVATIDLVPGTTVIRRVDRRRNITITADVLEGHDANQIASEMLAEHMDRWRQDFAGFSLSREGTLKTQAQFGDNFQTNFIIVLLVVLAIFSVAFRSLFQPLLVLLAIPFGFVGAVIGHLIFGQSISMMSFFGFLACSGVVVNDNLVLLERINQLKQQGRDVYDAVLNAGVDRFRPIVLTSLTTFIGLMPILFERSSQSQFLIPMVVSLAFGVLFSSVVTLFMVPCGYFSGNVISEWFKRVALKRTPNQRSMA